MKQNPFVTKRNQRRKNLVYSNIILLAILLLLLSGCAAQVSHTKLLPGIENIRTAFVINIDFSENINQTCRKEVVNAIGQPAPAFTYYAACSVIPPDIHLIAGKPPICKIFLPEKDWHSALQHEILHCMGYAHE